MTKKIRKTPKTVGINTVEQENKKPTVTLAKDIAATTMAAVLGFCVMILMALGIYTTLHVPDPPKQVIITPTPKKHSSPVFKEEGSDKIVEITPTKVEGIDPKKVKSNISDTDTLRMIFMRSHVSYPITKARYLAVSLGIGVDDTISKLPADKREKVIDALVDKKMSCR